MRLISKLNKESASAKREDKKCNYEEQPLVRGKHGRV
jgi:hypothetical protein